MAEPSHDPWPPPVHPVPYEHLHWILPLFFIRKCSNYTPHRYNPSLSAILNILIVFTPLWDSPWVPLRSSISVLLSPRLQPPKENALFQPPHLPSRWRITITAVLQPFVFFNFLPPSKDGPPSRHSGCCWADSNMCELGERQRETNRRS